MTSPSQDNNGEFEEGRYLGRASWFKEAIHTFCDVCIEYTQLSKGKQGTTTSQRKEWKEIAQELKSMSSLSYDNRQVKSKFDGLKILRGLWKTLKGREIGLVWDHEKGTIDVSSKWWAGKI